MTGGARYAAEFNVANLAHAVLVMSTIASGRIRSIDTKAALSAPGVLTVITHENAPRLNFPERPKANDDFVAPSFGRSLPVLQENTIYFNGQPIAVVVAENLEQAEHAATLVRVVYDETKHVTSIVDVLIEPATNESVNGAMQLLAECAERDASGAIATVFHIEGDVETTMGARALLYPDGTIDGDFPPLIFDDLREATNSCVRRYEVDGGYIDVFIEVVQPRVRLVVFGAGPDVLPIVNLAKMLSWHTTVVDTSGRVSSRERFGNADAVVLCRPEEVMSEVSLSERTSVVVMTHNYLHDVELVRQLLPLPVRYLGCLGPRQRTERLLHEISGDTRYRPYLHAPVGLDIGAETAEEIALSIVSEIKSSVVSAKRCATA